MFEIYNNNNIEFFICESFMSNDYVNFIVKMKLYNFSGEHNFCIAFNDLRIFIQKLTTIYENNNEEVKISDYDSESFICLKTNKDMTISLYGQLGSEWEENLWKFKQDFDQTFINLLITNLSILIKE